MTYTNITDKVGVFEKYGPLKPGVLYSFVKRGYDYCIVKCRGKHLYVPHKIIDFHPKTHHNETNNTINGIDESEFLECLDGYV